MCWNNALRSVWLLIVCLLCQACADECRDCHPEGMDGKVRVMLSLPEIEGCVGTRSILHEDSIENKLTDVTLASYDSQGYLVDAVYYAELDDPMSLSVNVSSGNSVYALVNMGDMTGKFPVREAGVSGIVYMLESYEDVASSGIPMCGVVNGCAYGDGNKVTVPLERLFARLNVRILHTGLKDGQTSYVYAFNLANKSLYLRQANRRLQPFAPGGSRAADLSDILDMSDYNPDLADMDAYQGSLLPSQLGPGLGYIKDTTVVLYVPENVQGCLLPENTDPFEKVDERIDNVGGKSYAGLCTYLEYNAFKPNKGEGYYGDVMYRCYIGEDNVSDFSIRRNRRYDLVMNFSDEGFFLDNWKVTRGENWVDTRTLCFVDIPFVIYPGTSKNLLVHYNRVNASSSVGSSGPASEWVYEFDEAAMAAAGLTYEFMGDKKVTGTNGCSEFYFRITTSETAKVGSSVPVRIALADGSKSDFTTVNVSSVGSLTPVWDFCPEYVSQTGELMVAGVVKDLLPLSVTVSDGSVLKYEKTGDDSFRFTAVGEGNADVWFSNADGSQTLSLSLAVSAPELKVSDVDIALSPDGEKGRLDYYYADKNGNPLGNVDVSAYEQYLKPVVSGCDYIASAVADSHVDLYVHKLYSAGKQIVAGSYYQMEIGAADCPEVSKHYMRAYVVDPFEGFGTISVPAIDDYTLFSMSDVPVRVRNCFSSQLSAKVDLWYEIPPVDAGEIYISSSLTPVWADGFSYENGVYSTSYSHSDSASEKGASLRLTQNAVSASTSHGAGKHDLQLHVKNRYSGERLSRTLATVDIYVHTAIGAKAAFGYIKGNTASGGETVASVYNSLAGTKVYSTTSAARIYYMDVSMEYLTPVDQVCLFDCMLDCVESGYNLFDALDWVRPSKDDGTLDLTRRLLYSVCTNPDQRMAFCGESYSTRKGVGAMLYRALAMATSTAALTDSQLKQLLLGYSGGSALTEPAYDIHDMNVGTDMTKNIVSKNSPYYFSPKSCAGNRDSAGRGYHVVHTLNRMYPSTSGWINLL